MADDPTIPVTDAPDLGQLVNAIAVVAQKSFGAGGIMKWVIDNAVQAILALIGVILRGATRIMTVVASGLQKALEQDNPEVGRLASTILGAMFGHEVAADIPGGILNPGNLDDNAEAVGAAILGAVFGPMKLAGGGALEPGIERAEGYLGVIANLVTRGFVMDMAEEIVPHWHFNFIHHLEHELISGLGLGRIARTVLRPVVTTMIADPAQWALNLAYRPKLLSVGDAINAWHRGTISGAALDDELGRQGWSADRIDQLVDANTKELSVDQLRLLVDEGFLDEGTAIARIAASGYGDTRASEAWTASRFARLYSFAEQNARMYVSRLESGFLSIDGFRFSIRHLGLPDDVAKAYIEMGERATNQPRRRLSLGELRDAWTKNLITQDDFHQAVIDEGYSNDDATTLVLLQLATVRDKAEAAQAKKDAETARAAAKAQADAAAAAKRAADKAAAEHDRQVKAQQLAAQKAKIAADELALKAFAADAARQKQDLVSRLHQTETIDADQAALARAQIDADLQQLLATIAGQVAASKASFERQILELKQADREATIAQQLADVDVAREADAERRAAAVQARLDDVDAALARQLADLDALYTARAGSIEQDLSDGLGAIDSSTLPKGPERGADVDRKIAFADAELARKKTDIAADYAERRRVNDANLDDGLVKQTPHDLEARRLDLAEGQAVRLVEQQHDLSVARLRGVATIDSPVAPATADTQRTTLDARAAKARRSLASEKLKAVLTAQQHADAEKAALASMLQQVGPITEAEAARRRRTIALAAAAAKRQDGITETEIAKGEADAKAAIDKAAQTVAAAKQRLAQVRAAASTKESAQAGASAALAALQAAIDRQRALLEQQLAADSVGIPPV